LLLTKDILEKLRYHSEESKKVFDDIKNNLTDLITAQDVTAEVKEIADKALKTIDDIEQYPAILENLEKLRYTLQDSNKIDELFAKAIKKAIELVNNNNVHYEHSKKSLIEFAAEFGNVKTINYLLEKQLETLKEKPAQLESAIYFAAVDNHQKALELLLSNDKIINAIIKSSGKDNLKDALEARFEDKKDQLDHVVKTRDNLVRNRNIKTVAIAGVVGAAVAGGTFVGALVAKKGLNLFKDTILVTNCLLPAFNKVNDQLMKISSKLDLNKLAKAITNPKVATLMVGVLAILGAISSALGVGAMAYRKQGGTILGR
jgi:ElaB/YqjD/DUF883 family membrane-anchored ribosome-binding protein